MRISGQQVIQEALEVSYMKEPKDFLDKLLQREPSESKLKSSSIMYLTDKYLKAEVEKEEAQRAQHEIFKDALRIIGMFDPKIQAEFHESHRTIL